MIPNYYEILGIERTATTEQIKKAYRVNAIKYHPDKNLDDPYFAKKFIAIKDAYDNLIDPIKRAEFESDYYNKYESPKSTADENQHQHYKKQSYNNTEKQENEKYRYDPHKQFYSDYDRELQETPQFNPIFNIWGERLSEDLDFFKLPKRIGKIIAGYSDLIKNTQPLTTSEKTNRITIGAISGLGIGAIIYFLANLTDPLWIAIWFCVPTIFIILLKIGGNKFQHGNLYIGINGFAHFVCENNRDNITTSTELNFNDITDLYVNEVDHSKNYSYEHTSYVYIWLDRKTGKVAYAKQGKYNKNANIREQPYMLNFYRTTEKYWTVYLLDKLEDTIQKHGHILFCLYSSDNNSYNEYIKLSIGKITFIKGKGEEFTYNFNDIKKIYTKGTELRIQHKNFERKLYFFKSGNEDVVPLTHLCNRQFFFRALDILLGYSIA